MNMLSLLDIDPSGGGVDWAVDGRALGKWATRWTTAMPTPSRNGFIVTNFREDLEALLGERPQTDDSVRALPSGRVPLYVCSHCGDLACGALCVRVTADDETVTWSDFCRENDYEDFGEPDPDFVDVPVIRFRGPDYVTTVRRALTR